MNVIDLSLVVVDWGAIRALPKSAEIPGDNGVLLADTIVCEIAGSNTPESNALKFRDVLAATDASRLLVGHYWDHLSRQEHSPDVVLEPDAIVNPQLTSQLRESLSDGKANWSERIVGLDDSDEMTAYERHRNEFVAKCEAWTRWIRERQPDELNRMAGYMAAQHEWIRIPTQVTELVVQGNPEKFDKPEWREALSVFPDRLAAGRWARIIVWYALMRSLNPEGNEHAFENNWDDAHYAFLASYAGNLVTADRGLKQLVEAVFPSVCVGSWQL